jgi:hypothetical protein
MRSRYFAAITALAALLVLVLITIPAAGQTKAKAYTPAKTADGQPSLQGYWTNNTITPLERPKGVTKEFYTEEELKALIEKEKDRVDKNEEEGRPTEPGTAEDVHYDFSQFGLDRGQTTLSWNRRTSMIVGPTGTLPPQIPEARKRNADLNAPNRGHEFDGPENRPLGARCLVLSYENVPQLSAGYNNNLQIVQGKGYVAIMHEMNHSVRMIPLDGSPHLPQSVHLWKGDSRGHWEGNTLVVDTTNFDARNPFRGSSEKMHVVERFTPVDKDTILYRFTVEDPATWDQPWTGETAWSRVNGPIYEFACHEGNYGLANTLRGARVDEAEAAKARQSK